MSEHWISAAQALAIARSPYVLCKRAHSGVVRTRAAVFAAGGQKIADADIPPLFWWAEGHEALDQDWRAGDFSTLIDQNTLVRCFGVTFALSDVLDLIPAEERAKVARELSIVGQAEWIAARQAATLVGEASGIDEEASCAWIVEQAALGFIAARAVEAAAVLTPIEGRKRNWARREWDVPAWFWSDFVRPHAAALDWATGAFEGDRAGPGDVRRLVLRNIHFRRETMTALLASGDDRSAPSSAKSVGGRPPAAFIDALWCAVWGQIYSGDLVPKSQADIERAMLEWASANDYPLSESAARTKARQAWKVCKMEDKNLR